MTIIETTNVQQPLLQNCDTRQFSCSQWLPVTHTKKHLWRTNRYSTAFLFACEILSNLLYPPISLKAAAYSERPWRPFWSPNHLYLILIPGTPLSSPKHFSSPKHTYLILIPGTLLIPINSRSNLSLIITTQKRGSARFEPTTFCSETETRALTNWAIGTYKKITLFWSYEQKEWEGGCRPRASVSPTTDVILPLTDQVGMKWRPPVISAS